MRCQGDAMSAQVTIPIDKSMAWMLLRMPMSRASGGSAAGRERVSICEGVRCGQSHQSSVCLRTEMVLQDLSRTLLTRELVARVRAGECRRGTGGAVGTPLLRRGACGGSVREQTDHTDARLRGVKAARDVAARRHHRPGHAAPAAWAGGEGKA